LASAAVIVRRAGTWLVWALAGACALAASFVVFSITTLFVPGLRLSVAAPPLEYHDRDGRLRFRSEMRQTWPDLLDEQPYGEGEFARWWESGALYQSGAFRSGKRDGRWCIYDEAGALCITAEFDRGVMVGPLRCRNRDTGVYFDSDVDPDFYFDTQPPCGPYEWK
jgi:hypothetical protein